LQVAWERQYVRLRVPALDPSQPAELRIDGVPTPFQYLGPADASGAEVLLRLGFDAGQTRTLEFSHAPAPAASGGRLLRSARPLEGDITLAAGEDGTSIVIPAPAKVPGGIAAPFSLVGTHPIDCILRCDLPLDSATLVHTHDGPLFTQHELTYDFGRGRTYRMTLRLYRHVPLVEVDEDPSLGMDAELR